VLALDGGGVRGAITVAFLERMEEVFSQHFGKQVCLGNHFNLVGGTSTGAIISGALALGYRASQVREFYTALAPLAFKRQKWSIPFLHAKFDVRGLRNEIEKIVGDLDLQSERIVTGLCVVTKRIDTGSPWILANNPAAPYWEDGPGHDGNKRYKLATLVRASTAAPSFFDPEILPISGRSEQLSDSAATPMEKSFAARVFQSLLEHVGWRKRPLPSPRDYGLFIDGGVTPHNNPSLALLQMVSLKPFKLCWTPGPENLSVTSVGTGTYRPRIKYEDLGFTRYAQLALHALMSLMTDAEMMVLAQMQWMGECPAPWVINSEIGTLAGDGPPGGKLFRFVRYDVRLEQSWLSNELGLNVPEKDIVRYRGMDDPGTVKSIYEIAKMAAVKQIKPEHFFKNVAGKVVQGVQPAGQTAA
jgi:hypothetical protein